LEDILMMIKRSTWGAALLVTFFVCAAGAAELESGTPVGEKITSYRCVKVGGVDDGVKVGKELCYT
jgi:hypothetical protein